MQPGRVHREQRRRRACRDTDLAVGVLDVGVGRLDGDPECLRDLLGLQAAREQPHDLRPPIGQTGGPLDSGDGLAGGGKHRGDRFGVQTPGAHLLAQRLCGLLGRQRPAVGRGSVMAW